jgi:CRISPR/Cas system-associated endonuclease Cas1
MYNLFVSFVKRKLKYIFYLGYLILLNNNFIIIIKMIRYFYIYESKIIFIFNYSNISSKLLSFLNIKTAFCE